VIETIAKESNFSVVEAKENWEQDLRDTKGSPFWYDYAYHCDRLGVDGQSVVKNAHERASNLLSIVPGAQQTLALLIKRGFAIGIVTDATSWVVKFKLETLGIVQPAIVFSSSNAQATKASSAYWRKLSQSQPDIQLTTYVDNRQVNLVSASRIFPTLNLVQFAMDEHVTTLSRSIAPKSEIAATTSMLSVHNHAQLRSWFLSNLPELVRK
jgi:FMN phosphatase YigB (HAD superfamily)